MRLGIKAFAVVLPAAFASILATCACAQAEERKTLSSGVACTSWAAWREFSLASIRPAGARMSEHCPLRIPKGETVTIVEDDAGFGATEIRWRGRNWFVDNQRLR